MADVHPRARWQDGQVVTPHELNEELAEMVGEINGHLDRDNFPDQHLTSEDLVLGATTRYLAVFEEALSSVAFNQTSEDEPPGWVDVPDLSGTLTTDDGRIILEAALVWESGAYTELGIRVDGRLVAVSPPVTAWQGTNTVAGVAVVAAGAHTISVQMRTYQHDSLVASIDCYDRQLLAIETRR